MTDLPTNDNNKEAKVSDILLLAHQASLIGEKIDSGKGTIADIDAVMKISYEIEVLEKQLLEQKSKTFKAKKPQFKLIKGGKI